MAIYEDLNISSDNFVPEIFSNLFSVVSNSDGSYAGIGILLLIYTVSYASVKRFSDRKASLFASTVTMITAQFMFRLGFINSTTVIITFVLWLLFIATYLMAYDPVE